jgi:dTDP-4-amino-4,6-dideoxygalactose transaminase
MTDIQAAIGREQLTRLPAIVARRRELAARYTEALGQVAGVATPVEPQWARTNWQSYCVRLAPGRDQRAVMQSMLERGISTRRAVMCSHREPAYPRGTWGCGPGECTCGPGTCGRLTMSEQLQDTGIILPLYHQMVDAEQDRVVAALLAACTR